jgi:thiol-disulfide isomerase/thioredoxin
MTRIHSISLAIMLFASTITNAQEGKTGPQPAVGKPMPDFTLKNITHYKTKEARLSDFKGKWLFLDFWFTGCTICIKSFPKVNSFHRQFKDKAVFMMVGLNEHRYNKDIQSLFERLRKKQNLTMPAAYDSVLFTRWGIISMPHIIVVNPEGIVHSITGGRNMTADKIKTLLDGGDVSFYPKDVDREDFNAESVADTAGALSSPLIYRSILTRWNGENQNGGFVIDEFVKLPTEYQMKGWSVSNVPLYALYNYAYLGRWNWIPSDSIYGKAAALPVLEIADTSLFQFDFINDVGKGTYNYNLVLPPSKITVNNMMQVLQSELKNMFGYEVSVETRIVPVWKLIAQPGAGQKLRSKGGEPGRSPGSTAAGFSVKNFPVKKTLALITKYISDYQTPFIDGTGIIGNIDFSIDADMTKWNEVRQGLQKLGLDLVKDKKPMSVIVIRDSKDIQ